MSLTAQVIETVGGLRNDDTIIVFMGPTGTGKSHFIDLLTGQLGRRASDSSVSVTTKVEATRVKHPLYGDRIVLIDTPGFDDTFMSDIQVLRVINGWLEKTYERGIKLSGIIYLHRITDGRMTGSLYKNFRIFGELYGDVAMEHVFLVSTMWEMVQSDIGAAREAELIHKFWKPMIERGSIVERLEKNEPGEAWRVVNRMIQEKKRKEMLLHAESDLSAGGSDLPYFSLQSDRSDRPCRIKASREQLKRNLKLPTVKLLSDILFGKEENGGQYSSTHVQGISDVVSPKALTSRPNESLTGALGNYGQ